MSDYKYKYYDPIQQGHTKFTLTKTQHNKLFEFRQIHWSERYEYYYNEHHIILHKFANWKCITLSTILFPLFVLLHGVVNFKECWKELRSLYNQKETGSFVSDHVSSGTDRYIEIMKIIGVKKRGKE